MYTVDLRGKHALVMGVANHRSLSWAIAQCLAQAGAELCLTYASERLKSTVEELGATLPGAFTLPCDVTQDGEIDAVAKVLAERWGSVEMLVHGIAFARKEDLEGSFVATPREGFQLALEVSAYSFLNVTHRVLPLLEKNGGSVVTLSYLAAERAVPNYNVMGSAKAVLEQSTRQMALELGARNVRVNCISAGPVSTLAARGIHGFTNMLKEHGEAAPLKRNITKEEVGSAGLFLLSDLGSGITGTTLYVDAGWHILGH
ncbi:MAG TPA: enoyl-ACP reductase [Candidatus Acidoferrales bacterium]|nr:enoyl-ACP reductase [Candidatus Acidoferrales bacterium]